jgi:hypothetical protein
VEKRIGPFLATFGTLLLLIFALGCWPLVALTADHPPWDAFLLRHHIPQGWTFGAAYLYVLAGLCLLLGGALGRIRKGRWVWVGVGIIGLLLHPAWLERWQSYADYRCGCNMGTLSSALVSYELAHGGKLPNASKWVDEIYPYLDTEDSDVPGGWAVFRCPDDLSVGRSSYAMNRAVSGKQVRNEQLELLDPMSTTIAIYETARADRNPFGNGTDLPQPSRHLEEGERINRFILIQSMGTATTGTWR